MKNILILLSVLTTQIAIAQPDTTSTSLLHKYRAMALSYNDDLKSAEKNIKASIELTKAAQADRGPKLSAGGETSYTGNSIEISLNIPSAASPFVLHGANAKHGISATLLQPVYVGGRVLESIRMAKSQQMIASSQAELIRSLVCYQTDIQYWHTVGQSEIKKVATDFRNSVANLTRIVNERVEAGVSDRQELLTAEVKLNEAEYQLLQAQSELETELMALNSLIGVPLETPTKIDYQIAPIERMASVLAEDNNLRPELKIAQEHIKIETSALKLNDAQYKPQFYVGASGGYYSPGYNFRPDLSPNYTVYAQLSVPIFHWGKRRNEKRASQQRIAMASDNLHKVETTVELEIKTALTALNQAMQRVELAQSSLDKAQENEHRATGKYQEGAISVTEVIDAQVYRQTAQMNYVSAKLTAQMHYSELLRATNGYN